MTLNAHCGSEVDRWDLLLTMRIGVVCQRAPKGT